MGFSLTNSYSMHQVILAHVCLFWVICHPSRTFPPKELERETQNRLPFLPIVKPHPFLPLTHGLRPLYWLGTSRCLSLMRAPLLYESIDFLVFMRLPLPASLFGLAACFVACLTLVAWMSHWVFILCMSFLLWVGYCLGVGFFFFNSALVSFHFWFMG